MTSKEKVLSVYPDARCVHYNEATLGPLYRIFNTAGDPLSALMFQNADCAWDDAASKLPSAPSPAEETAKCGECVIHLIAGSSFYPCGLEKGHVGDGHRGSGNCFKHGAYLGEVGAVPQCPCWPDCVIPLSKSLPEPMSPEVIHVPRIPGTVNTPVGPMIPAPEAAAAGEEYTVDTHKLGTCLRFANGETCIGCGDKKNGEPLPVAAPIAPAAEDEIDALINEVAPPPLVVSETAIRQLRPLLLELIDRRMSSQTASAASPVAGVSARGDGCETGPVTELLNSMKVIDRSHRYMECRADLLTQYMYELVRLRAQPSAEGDGWIADGVSLITAERKRQVQSEGWTPEHDSAHQMGEMAAAAMCYASTAIDQELHDLGDSPNAIREEWWPWDEKWWKPSDPIRNLVKAGALIAAEIDRLQRRQQ